MFRKIVGDGVSSMRAQETHLYKHAQLHKLSRLPVHTATATQLRGIHNNMHTVGLLKEDIAENLPQIPHKSSDSLSLVSVPMKDRPKATSGDYCSLGTDSEEYHHLDTNPKSLTEPYEHPRLSGSQLRYGGMPQVVKEDLDLEDGSG